MTGVTSGIVNCSEKREIFILDKMDEAFEWIAYQVLNLDKSLAGQHRFPN